MLNSNTATMYWTLRQKLKNKLQEDYLLSQMHSEVLADVTNAANTPIITITTPNNTNITSNNQESTASNMIYF
jgi:hypothetical protein